MISLFLQPAQKPRSLVLESRGVSKFLFKGTSFLRFAGGGGGREIKIIFKN